MEGCTFVVHSACDLVTLPVDAEQLAVLLARLLPGVVHPADLGGLGVGELGPASALAATGTRSLETVHGALADEVALKLGEHARHLEERLAHRVVAVERPAQ